LQVNKAEIGDAEKKTLEKELFVRPSPEMVLAEIFEKCGRYKKVKEIKEKYGY
jgi:hypothetical protein